MKLGGQEIWSVLGSLAWQPSRDWCIQVYAGIHPLQKAVHFSSAEKEDFSCSVKNGSAIQLWHGVLITLIKTYHSIWFNIYQRNDAGLSLDFALTWSYKMSFKFMISCPSVEKLCRCISKLCHHIKAHQFLSELYQLSSHNHRWMSQNVSLCISSILITWPVPIRSSLVH